MCVRVCFSQEKRRAAMARTAERERVRADKQHQRKMDRAVKEVPISCAREGWGYGCL